MILCFQAARSSLFFHDAFEDGLKNKKSTELASIIGSWLSIVDITTTSKDPSILEAPGQQKTKSFQRPPRRKSQDDCRSSRICRHRRTTPNTTAHFEKRFDTGDWPEFVRLVGPHEQEKPGARQAQANHVRPMIIWIGVLCLANFWLINLWSWDHPMSDCTYDQVLRILQSFGLKLLANYLSWCNKIPHSASWGCLG